jgi:polygalacturonase
MMNWLVFIVLLVETPLVLSKSLLDFPGAISGSTSVESAWKNARAFEQALYALNSTAEDRTLWIPSDSTFYMLGTTVVGLVNITIQLDGQLIAHPSIQAWEDQRMNMSTTIDLIQLVECHQMFLKGQGVVDGNGYDWWLRASMALQQEDWRPNLVRFIRSTYIVIEGWRVRNSPFYHFYLIDVANVVIRGVDVYVSRTQKYLVDRRGVRRRWNKCHNL